MKYNLTSVIPVVQYGNIQPSIEVEADTFEEAQALIEPQMLALWNKYNPGVMNSGQRQLVKAFVGGEVYYDEASHTYTDEAGQVYLSSSVYAKQFEKPFDTVAISDKMATKWGADASEIRKMWELKAEISRGLGTMIHSALELYGRYNGLAKQLEKTTHLHDHPVVKKAVESFYLLHKEKAEYEALVVDHQNKRASRIDRLVILGDKHARVEDYKTNAEMTPEKLKAYWKQLDFSGEILAVHGWKVDPPVIHHWNGDWKTIQKERSAP